MGQDFILAALVCRRDTPEQQQFDAAHAAVDAITSADQFNWTDDEWITEQPQFEADGCDALTQLGPHQARAHQVLTDLQEALAGSEVDYLTVAGLNIYLTGGMSWGEEPTDACAHLWLTRELPAPVQAALGVVADRDIPMSAPKWSNTVTLRGTVSQAPTQALAEGDAERFRLVVQRPQEAGGAEPLVDVFEVECSWSLLRQQALGLREGDEVVVTGALRRRFHKGPGETTTGRVLIEAASLSVVQDTAPVEPVTS